MRQFNFCAAPLIAILLSCAAAALGGELNTLTPAEKAGGWKLLFDGKETSGWRAYAHPDFPQKGWGIEDGCLKNEGGVRAGDLVTKETFTDFDLKFEWRVSPGANSGVKYLVKEGTTGKAGVGFEYQVLDDDANPDGQLHKHKAGDLYDLIAANSAKRLKPVGQFNQGEIIVRGNHCEHWLNGAKIVECELGSPEFKQAKAASKFAKIPWFGEKRTTVILLQDHGDTVWFRNLKIKELKPE